MGLKVRANVSIQTYHIRRIDSLAIKILHRCVQGDSYKITSLMEIMFRFRGEI